MKFLDSLRTVTTNIKNYIDNKFNKLGDLASLDEVTMDNLASDVKKSLNNKDLTFTGAVTDTYNGTTAKTVNIVGKAGTGEGAELFNYASEASGQYSHAEGERTVALGEGSHAEGVGSSAYVYISGEANTTTYTVNSYEYLNAVKAGLIIRLSNKVAKITSYDSTALIITVDKTLSETAIENQRCYTYKGAYGKGAHSEGMSTTASGNGTHAEGYGAVASGDYSHAEGYETVAFSGAAHAEGGETVASGVYAHAEGLETIASAQAAHAEGQNTVASGLATHAEGLRTVATQYYQHAQGKYNKECAAWTTHIVGNGNSDTERSNAHTIDFSGNGWFAGAVTTNGADYAELFEWVDGNVDNEDRRGRFVTLDGEKVRFATVDDDYILGVVSAAPAVLGDRNDCWQGRFVTDIFGERLTKEYITIDEETGEERTNTWWIENPEYDSSMEYVPREDRKEWAKVGMVGKLVVVDDGTCEVNGYCKPGVDGVATASDVGYRVMSRIDENHIRVLVK